MTRCTRVVAGALIALTLAYTTIQAQERWFRGFGGRGEGYGVPPRFPNPDEYDGAFTFCRVMYQRVRQHERGLGWSTDYPDADRNFSIRFAELTKARVSRTNEEPNHFVVRLTDEYLYQCPFILMSDPGSAGLNDAEVAALRAYLLKGGFLWVDDFWGPRAWDDFAGEIGKALPATDYPIREIAADHPIMRTLFEVSAIPQVPSIQFWRYSGGETSELGNWSAQAHMAAISDPAGHIMVLMTHNTDISDSWEREGDDPQFFYHFSPLGYGVGLNVMVYAMSH